MIGSEEGGNIKLIGLGKGTGLRQGVVKVKAGNALGKMRRWLCAY